MESLGNWEAEWTTVDPQLSMSCNFGMDHLLLEGLVATGALVGANYDSDLSGGHTSTFDYGLDCLLSSTNTADTTSGDSGSLSQPPPQWSVNPTVAEEATTLSTLSKKRKRDPDPDPKQFTLIGSECGFNSPSYLRGGFKLIEEPKTSISFQGGGIQQGEVEVEADAEAIQQMKEMIYRAAAFRPVNLGVDELVEKPRRKNVKISSDPQTVAARQRRERISERLRVLQKLVPGGSKMDTASMLDEAANYLKFLRSQVKALESMSPTSSSSNGILPSVNFNFNSSTFNSFPYSSPYGNNNINGNFNALFTPPC